MQRYATRTTVRLQYCQILLSFLPQIHPCSFILRWKAPPLPKSVADSLHGPCNNHQDGSFNSLLYPARCSLKLGWAWQSFNEIDRYRWWWNFSLLNHSIYCQQLSALLLPRKAWRMAAHFSQERSFPYSTTSLLMWLTFYFCVTIYHQIQLSP